jgi:hypothetical protein
MIESVEVPGLYLPFFVKPPTGIPVRRLLIEIVIPFSFGYKLDI